LNRARRTATLPSVKTQSPDTSPEAERVLIELTRKLPVARRLELAWQWSATMRRLGWENVRASHPGADEAELRRHYAARLLGPELASKVLAHAAARGS
jgi:hypothetical protein